MAAKHPYHLGGPQRVRPIREEGYKGNHQGTPMSTSRPAHPIREWPAKGVRQEMPNPRRSYNSNQPNTKQINLIVHKEPS